VHLVVVVVGGGVREVVVVVVVVFVTSIEVDVFAGVDFDDEVVFEELDEDEDDDDALAELVLDGSLGWVVVDRGTDWVVPSVATCSNRTGGRSPVRWAGCAARPTPNNAAMTAPRNAPTASRNGAPR
jgi:hypothetical protein